MNKGMLHILKKLNQDSVVTDYQKELGQNCDFKHLPISPSMIEDDDTLVVFNDKATKDYKLLVDFSNSDFASIEYPFAILGNRKNIDGESVIVLEKFVFCHDIDTTLSSRKVEVDSKKLVDVMADSDHSILVWGRVHGAGTADEKESAPVSMLSGRYLEKYNIRKPELNIRLDEIDEYLGVATAVYNQKFDKEVYHATIMPNGEVAMLNVDEGKFQKFENIEVVDGNEVEEVPVWNYDTKFSKGFYKAKK